MFTTIEAELIENMCPIAKQFSLGHIFQPLATGYIPTAGMAGSDTTGGKMSDGCYQFSTLSSGIHKITSGDVAIGSRISAFNPTSGTTSYFLTSSGATDSQLNATGANVAILAPGERIDMYKVTTSSWTIINDTGDFTSIQIDT